MKTLKNHLILFDAECPMCRLYTQAFVDTGLLDQTGRESYQKVLPANCPNVDRQRAVNEIALINQETGEVSYGVYSLFKIIGNAFPFFNPLFSFRPFAWIMSKAYAFISYNRRVIITAPEVAGELQPSFKLHYRITYLLLTWLVTSIILTRYVLLMAPFVPAGGPYREYLVCFGQIIFQGIVVSALFHGKQWNYLGNVMTISFGGALLLLLMLVFHRLIGTQPLVFTGWFIIVVGLMFLEHLRRSRIMGLGFWMTASWVTYRVIVLLLISLNQ
jgi:hypothetical protein